MRNYLTPVAARYGSIVLQFVVVATVTRVLPQSDAGHYFVIMGLVLATYFVTGFGLPDGVVRFAPALAANGNQKDAAALLRQGFRYSLATVPIGATIIGAVVLVYSGGGWSALLAGAWWASYGIIFLSAQILVAGGRSEAGTAVFYSAANVGQFFITIPIILLTGLGSLEMVLLATVLGTSFSAALCLFFTWRLCDTGTAGHPPSRECWQQGVSIAAGRVVQSCLIWSPVWVVSFTLGASDAALVGLASRLVSAAAAAIAAVRFSIRPAMARNAALGNWSAIKTQSSRIALFATGLAVSAIVVTSIAGDPLITLLFGAGYRGVGGITALMLIGTVGESFGGPVDEVLRMSGHATEVIGIQTVILALAVVAQYFAGRWGGVNAVVATYGLMFVLLYQVFIFRVWRLKGILILPWPRTKRN